jgi:hypothetical protein
MRSSSAAEVETVRQYQQNDTVDITPGLSNVSSIVTEPLAVGSASAQLKAPNFGALAAVYAITSRIAGRINAASISDEEQTDLLRRRQALLDKELTGTLTRTEQNALEYIRWSLDRIEDAKYGAELDELEEAVRRYERFEIALRDFNSQLSERSPKRSKHTRGRINR